MLSRSVLPLILLALFSLPLSAQEARHIELGAVDVTALAWDSIKSTLYFSTSSGALVRSKGVNGEPQTIRDAVHTDHTVDAIAARGDTLFIATSGSENYELRTSSDGGESWEEVVVYGINRYGVRAVGIGNSMLWMIDKSLKALVSRDNGATWQPLIGEESELWVNSIATEGEEIIAGTETGLYRSTDGGLNWTSGVGGMTGDVSDVVIDGKGLLGVVSTPASDGLRTVLKLYHLRDRNDPAPEEIPFPDIDNVNRTYSHCLVKSGDAILLGVFRNYHHQIGETRLMRTDDNGKQWSVCTGIDSLGRLAAVQAGNSVVVADGMRLLASSDHGASFDGIDDELKGNPIKTMKGSGDLIVESRGYLYHSYNDEMVRTSYESWTAPPYRLLAARGETILATTGNPMESYGSQILIRSTDEGKTWKEVDNGLLVTSYLYSDQRKVTTPISAIADDIDRFAALSLTGVYLSNDGGATWRGIDTKGWKRLTEDAMDYRDIVLLDDNIFVATDLGIVKGSAKSGGWKLLKSWPKDRDVRWIARGGPKLYAATESGLFISSDQGGTWRAVEGMQDVELSGLAVRGVNAAVIVNGDVLRSSDAGSTWTPVEQGVGVGALSVHFSDFYLWINSVQNGVWRVRLDTGSHGR